MKGLRRYKELEEVRIPDESGAYNFEGFPVSERYLRDLYGDRVADRYLELREETRQRELGQVAVGCINDTLTDKPPELPPQA